MKKYTWYTQLTNKTSNSNFSLRNFLISIKKLHKTSSWAISISQQKFLLTEDDPKRLNKIINGTFFCPTCLWNAISETLYESFMKASVRYIFVRINLARWQGMVFVFFYHFRMFSLLLQCILKVLRIVYRLHAQWLPSYYCVLSKL